MIRSSTPHPTKRELQRLAGRAERIERAVVALLMARYHLTQHRALLCVQEARSAQRDAWAREAGLDPRTGEKI